MRCIGQARSQAARKKIREGRTASGTTMLTAGAAALDGTAPAAVVADELLALDVEGRAGLLRCEPSAGARSTVP